MSAATMRLMVPIAASMVAEIDREVAFARLAEPHTSRCSVIRRAIRLGLNQMAGPITATPLAPGELPPAVASATRCTRPVR